VYGRTLGERVLDFGHEGVLYRKSFMMYDRQTESLWLHVTGQALKGELKGAQLDFLPVEVVPWSDWRERYPDTKVLVGEKAEGFMGDFQLWKHTADYGLSVGEGREVALFEFEMLVRVPVLNDRGGPRPLVVAYDPRRTTAAAFFARVEGVDGGVELHFEAVVDPEYPSPLMRDVETGSLWDRGGGRCLAGPLAGRALERAVSVPWLNRRWQGFFPEGRRVTLPQLESDADSEDERED